MGEREGEDGVGGDGEYMPFVVKLMLKPAILLDGSYGVGVGGRGLGGGDRSKGEGEGGDKASHEVVAASHHIVRRVAGEVASAVPGVGASSSSAATKKATATEVAAKGVAVDGREAVWP